ncbi:saccharopine dehydrogenase NADP-binding domain-containing protein [Actinoplanes sp. NEAU-A12]|uniref:Saccharopine dehydrogenase NADP-binding domain-containing protein n=1 Tax=Actinoplanes sandaracinus TaxID=3045177 RepID=A0ABT6WST2_9ACTN|nr:saccharopine dehydrogenase NADP-binding domain-containing protein [Actinoplanes sandaracinus]MDI6102741.1 saccharopine dehydrogenase NADP-binding domain-containing protein [Actinoplanes sandaracinus]
MTTKTLIVGGYGAVGREAAAALVADTAVLVAGRRPERARTVPGATAVRLDVTDAGRLDEALDGVGAVLMCTETGNARMARACLDRGIDYVDISATPSVLAQLEKLDSGGATAVLSVGIAPGVTNLLARYAAGRAPGRPVRIGVLLGSGERHGAAAVGWTVDGLGQERGTWTAGFPAPYGRRTVHRFPFSDQHTLDLPDVRTGLALDSRPATAMLGAANRPAVANLLRRPALRGLTDAVFGGLHLGGEGFAVTVEAGDLRVSFTGHRQSRATGLFAAHVIRRLPGMRPGVAHIEDRVDPAEFLTGLAAEGFQLDLGGVPSKR